MKEVKEKMYCSHCGKKIPDDTAYCMYCGKPVTQARSNHEKERNTKKPQEKKNESLFIGVMTACAIVIFISVAVLFYFKLFWEPKTKTEKGTEVTTQVASEPTTQTTTQATTAQTTEATTAATSESKDSVSFDTDEKKEAREKASGMTGEQVVSDSSSRLLTDDEIKAMSQGEIQTAINEIYARHGYQFKDQAIYDYFSKYDWYQPDTSDQEVVRGRFNSTEVSNLELLQSYRK